MKDQYGEYIKLKTLPIGTKFWVRNGYWDGEIVEQNGVKCLHCIGHFVRPITDNEELAINITSGSLQSYVKKPKVVQAIQWTGKNYNDIRDFCGVHPRGHGHCWYSVDDINYVGTLEGDHIASIGDYIIRGIKGEFYPCKEDIFNETYEKVEG